MVRKALIGIFLALLIILPYTAEAQTPTVELTKTIDGGLTTIDSGAVFTYVLQYRCVGIVANCDNVTVSDILPPGLAGGAGDVVLIGTPHTTGQTYDPATRTATWTFINPLPAGSTGELRMQVRFPPGVTPNGTIAQNQATIDATQYARLHHTPCTDHCDGDQYAATEQSDHRRWRGAESGCGVSRGILPPQRKQQWSAKYDEHHTGGQSAPRRDIRQRQRRRSL